jgi:tetratricopeptide (TPR) repeat protein
VDNVGKFLIQSKWRALAGLAPILVSISVLPAYAQSMDEAKCTTPADIPPDERISGCISVIESGKYGLQGIIRAYFGRSSAYLKKGDLDLAVADYTQVIQRYPKNWQAYFCRGYAYFRKGDNERAIADYSELVRLNPQAEAGYIARGSAYAKEGELDRAIADFDHAKQLNPNDKNVYLGRGRVFLDRGDVDSAIAECDRAIQIDPKDGRAYLYRGHAFADRGDFRSAVADYDRAIQLDPKNALLYRARSISGLYAGLLSQAQTDIDQSRALDPKDSYAALWLDILAKRGNVPSQLAKAVQQLDMAKWPAPIIRLVLGETTAEAALAAADDPDAKRKKGQVCEANFYIGQLALQQGAKEEAARLFQLAVTVCPKSFFEWWAAEAELKGLGIHR